MQSTSYPAHKVYQRIRFLLIDFVAERRHVAANVSPVHDRIEDARVADFFLPLCLGEIARVAKLSFRSLCAPIAAVTRHTILPVQLRRGAHVAAVRGDREAADNEHEQPKPHHNSGESVVSFVYSAKNINRR